MYNASSSASCSAIEWIQILQEHIGIGRFDALILGGGLCNSFVGDGGEGMGYTVYVMNYVLKSQPMFRVQFSWVL